MLSNFPIHVSGKCPNVPLGPFSSPGSLCLLHAGFGIMLAADEVDLSTFQVGDDFERVKQRADNQQVI